MRVLYISFLYFLFSFNVAQAEWLLKKDGVLDSNYIVQFDSQVSGSLKSPKDTKQVMSRLRTDQLVFIQRLNEDLQHTDLLILRNLWIKQSVSIQISESYLQELQQLPYVLEVRPEKKFKAVPQSITTLPLSSAVVQDNLEALNIDALWNDEYKGQGVTVAILDSGVDIQHEDLVNRYRGGVNSWFDAYGEQSEPIDIGFTGHGTAVASIVLGGDASGSFIGVAPNAQWIAARIFNNQGDSTESAISETLQWVVDPDDNIATDDYPDIVQNSWGLGGSAGTCDNPFQVELAAIDALGIDIVFAVGNDGNDGFSTFLTPAFDSHVISVGAIDDNNILLQSSSRGPDVCGSSVIPSLVAPGRGIKAADITFGGFDPDNTNTQDGTSFSSPHISGVLAILRSRYSTSNHLLFRQALFDSAVDLGGQNDYGYGKVDVQEANDLLANQLFSRDNEVGFSHALYKFNEKDSTINVSVIRSGDLNATASVKIQSIDGSAVSNTDFLPIDITLDFAVGEGLKSVPISLVSDSVEEPTEAFQLRLSDANQVALTDLSIIKVTVEDDDSEDAAIDEEEIGGAINSTFLFLFALLALLRRKIQ